MIAGRGMPLGSMKTVADASRRACMRLLTVHALSARLDGPACPRKWTWWLPRQKDMVKVPKSQRMGQQGEPLGAKDHVVAGEG